jgi:hypothetical protein
MVNVAYLGVELLSEQSSSVLMPSTFCSVICVVVLYTLMSSSGVSPAPFSPGIPGILLGQSRVFMDDPEMASSAASPRNLRFASPVTADSERSPAKECRYGVIDVLSLYMVPELALTLYNIISL